MSSFPDIERLSMLVLCPTCDEELNVQGRCAMGHQVQLDSHNVARLHPKDYPDAYDEEDMVLRYRQYALGAKILREGVGSGVSEGLYRTVADLTRDASPQGFLVDAGCGVGRTTYDLAAHFPGATVLGFDLSHRMAVSAAQLCQGQEIRCGLLAHGWEPRLLALPKLKNATVVQADARRIAFRRPPDLILANMLLDRLPNPNDVLDLLAKWAHDLSPGGVLIITTPFNWEHPGGWQQLGFSTAEFGARLTSLGFILEDIFEGMPYRERIDPAGTYLELPVSVFKARRGR